MIDSVVVRVGAKDNDKNEFPAQIKSGRVRSGVSYVFPHGRNRFPQIR